jgi:hypothetical protein
MKKQKKEKPDPNDNSANRKLQAYVEHLFVSLKFKKDIAALRKKYKIPQGGLKKHIYKYEPSEKDEMPLIMLPSQIDSDEFMEDATNMLQKYGLSPDWFDEIQFQTAYNESLLIPNLIPAIDVPAIYVYDGNVVKHSYKIYEKSHPVTLLINPYTTERDLIDFITKKYKSSIKPIQDKYKIPGIFYGKKRLKNPKLRIRDNYIYQNRNSDIKKLTHETNEKFGCILGYADIRKILIKEKKRRETKEK